MFSLYNFLNEHQNDDPETLHITGENGNPMFSLDDLKEIQATIRHQTSRPMSNNNARQIIEHVKEVYAPAIELAASMKSNAATAAAAAGGARRRRRTRTRTRTRGGATVGVGVEVATPAPPAISLRDPTAPGYDPKDDALGVAERPGFQDKSRNSFFDRIFMKMGNMYSNSPFALKFSHKWDGIFWFMFLLYNLENIDIIGPFLSAGLDAYIVACRMAAEAIDENMPKILTIVGGILPIGVGGLGGAMFGEGLSAVIGGVILMGTIIVSISRKHFGDAFKSSLDIIPVIGDYLLLFAMSAETNLDRLNAYRNKLIYQLQPVSPRLYAFVDYWVPKLEPVPAEAPPIPSLADIKEDIVNKGMEATGANEALAKVQNITANPLGAVAGQLPAMPAMPALPTVPNMPAMPAMPAVPALPTAPNMPAIPTPSIESAAATVAAPNGEKAAFPPTPAPKRGGSRRRGYKRTKRRHTIKRR
ncbi:MAG: hypothetical protein EBT28_00885 [Betaproteobacteria bacterium]|nr:hypothetical protein [Betaproteobacteria bacterium]